MAATRCCRKGIFETQKDAEDDGALSSETNVLLLVDEEQDTDNNTIPKIEIHYLKDEQFLRQVVLAERRGVKNYLLKATFAVWWIFLLLYSAFIVVALGTFDRHLVIGVLGVGISFTLFWSAFHCYCFQKKRTTTNETIASFLETATLAACGSRDAAEKALELLALIDPEDPSAVAVDFAEVSLAVLRQPDLCQEEVEQVRRGLGQMRRVALSCHFLPLASLIFCLIFETDPFMFQIVFSFDAKRICWISLSLVGILGIVWEVRTLRKRENDAEKLVDELFFIASGGLANVSEECVAQVSCPTKDLAKGIAEFSDCLV